LKQNYPIGYDSKMLKPFMTTGIGSLPLRSVEDSCSLVLSSFDIPFWPQLPRLSFREFMIPQYAEGMPFLKMDEKAQTVHIGEPVTDELERFYESCTENSRIAISEDFAKGLHGMLRMIRGRRFSLFKGHITGPLTFTLGLKDAEGKAVYYNEELREISLMLLKAKTRWQMDLLKQHADRVIIFIDEPILSALGSSAYLGVSTEETSRLLREVTDTIRAEGGLSGIHCCGNADWPLVIGSGVDILNFDAFDYAGSLAVYSDQCREFLSGGGWFAWGIVPTSDAIIDADIESIRQRFLDGMDRLSERIPSDLLRSRILLTPSCGTGSRTPEEAIKIFQLLMRLKEAEA